MAWARHLVRGPEGTADLTHRAWQAAASLVLVGEPRGDERPHPVRSVTEGGPGAVEVSARVHGFTTDPATAPLATSESARRATAWGVAVHWTPVAPVRLGATVERTVFEGFGDGAPFPAETAVVVRAAFEV